MFGKSARLSRQCRDNLSVRENLGKSPAKLDCQLSTQCVYYSFAVISALLLEDLDANAPAEKADVTFWATSFSSSAAPS
jgi:hypothetical protein